MDVEVSGREESNIMMTKETESGLLKVTSLINTYRGNKKIGTATCFFCQNSKEQKFLVTNNHVISNVTHIELILTIGNEIKAVIIELLKNVTRHDFYDLCVMDITKIYNDALSQWNTVITFINHNGIIKDFNEFKHIENLIMIGYPSTLRNESENMPIIRTGITATSLAHKCNNEDMFLFDIPTVGGSSGSPIFVVKDDCQPYLVGINCRNTIDRYPVYEASNRLFHKKKIIGYTWIPNSLGIAIKSNVLLELIEQ